MANFRVTVQMHNFFADHRSLCRLFVTADMKTILDLQDHIAKIFHLKEDFYLLSDRLYLPRNEDVRILKEDDTIVVIPWRQAGMPNNITANSVIDEHPVQRKLDDQTKIKEKRSCSLESEDECVIKKRKKKKTQKTEAEDVGSECTVLAVPKYKEKKNKKLYKEEAKTKSSIPTNNGAIVKDGDCTEEEEEEEGEVKRVCNSSDYSKMPVVITRSKPIKLMPICTTPKVIKSIQVRDVPCTNQSSLHNKTDLQITSVETPPENIQVATLLATSRDIPNAVVKENSFLMLDPMNVDQVKPENGEVVEHSVKSISSDGLNENCPESVQSNCVEAVQNKRKRKRVRKRGKKELTPNLSMIETVTQPVIKSTDVPRVHIRYEEEKEEDDISCQGEVIIAELDVAATTNFDYKKLCNDEIIMYPIMRDKIPRTGDIIAFKTYMLSKSYTPELCDMVAKVSNYCSSTNQVEVQILVGAEYLKTPEGKFHMELDDEAQDEGCRTFHWNELIEPRLLFP